MLVGLVVVKLWNPSHPVHVAHHIGIGCEQLARMVSRRVKKGDLGQ